MAFVTLHGPDVVAFMTLFRPRLVAFVTLAFLAYQWQEAGRRGLFHPPNGKRGRAPSPSGPVASCGFETV